MSIEDAVAIPVGPGTGGPGPVGPASADLAVAEGRTVDGRAGDGRAGVRLEAGRRPESAAHVSLEGWEGPLGLLLALIEARQLDVLTVPLGSLAGAYLDALASLEDDRLGHVSAFVAVAGQLILIKSRALLPRQPAAVTVLPDDAADPEAELRARLLRYRAYRDAGHRLADVALERIGLFHRDPTVAHAAGLAGARAPAAPPLDPTLLAGSIEVLFRIVPPPPPPPETIRRAVTLAERADWIRRALRVADVVVLQDLLRGVRDRVVIAVTFLAMLELMKRREIVVEQAGPWAPIVARATTAEERVAAGVAIDVVADPIDESLGSFA